MQHTSPTSSSLTENFQISPMSTSTMSDVAAMNNTSYPSLLMKKKLILFEKSSATTCPPVPLIKPSSTTLSINENEPVKSASRRRKPLRPWSLSARIERPNSVRCRTALELERASIEPISDNDDHASVCDRDWPKHLSTIEEILKLYHVEINGSVQCIRCECTANQDNLLEHVSVHYPYKCYSCGFYCDSSSDLDEHISTHKSSPLAPEHMPIPLSSSILTSTKLSEPSTGGSSERSSASSKAKLHRCRQCPFVSSVKEEYWAHHRIHIRADKILECPSCPFVTEYKHHLEYHLRNHLGSKPFKCSRCDYACVNLSMLRSHKKSHFRHLLFKCSNCSFESKQYHTLQEHLQTEGHEVQLDDNVEEFLKEYANGTLPTNATPQNSNSIASKVTTRQANSKKRKVSTTTSILAQRRSSASSMDSSTDAISPISIDEPPSNTLVCNLCDYVAASKEGLGVHLFQHACKKSDLINRSLLASATMDPTAKLIELFSGKIGSTGQLHDFMGPYQQFLTQQLQSHLSTASTSSSSNLHHHHLDSNNNPTPSSLLSTNGYSLLASCVKHESIKRQRRETPGADDDDADERGLASIDQQTQVDEWQIKRLFECFHCEMIFKDFAMYCTHKQLHYSAENPFRCAQCGEQKANKYDFFVHVAQQAHELT